MRRVAGQRRTGECPLRIAVIVSGGGAFTDPTLTAEQMVERVRGKLKERHIPGFLAKSIVNDIPMLARRAKR